MKSHFAIISFLVFCFSIISAQENSLVYKLDSPEYVVAQSDFETNLILHLDDEDIDSLRIFIAPDNGIILDSVLFRDGGEKFIEFDKKYSEQISDDAFYFDLLASDSTLTYFESFQIVCYFSSEKNDDAVIKFLLPPFAAEKKFNDAFSLTSSNEQDVHIKFYRPELSSGGALLLNSGGEFNIKLKDISAENLLIGFWMRTDLYEESFFCCSSVIAADTAINLSIDRYNLLSFNNSGEVSFFDEKYFSPNTWQYVGLFFNSELNSLDVYSADKLLFRKNLLSRLSGNEINLSFSNNGGGNNFLMIDNLSIRNFNNNIKSALDNRRFNYFRADSSELIVSFDFENDNLISTENEKYSVELKNYKLLPSDAPIFSRAPSLDADVFGSYYNLNWDVMDSENASEFIIEKSFDGHSFIPLATIENSPDKTEYSFSDARDMREEVVYYRIKQINLSGAEIFSSVLKIGQGEIDYFSLDQNYPNPFNPVTSISFEVFEQVEVELSVYDIVGKKIAVLHKGTLGAGKYSFDFDGTDLPSGIYFYEIKSPFSSIVKKMILAK